ncbi:MAG: hypothetical protein IKD17_02340 [Alistipes sp.]|nr:hypothetical protein [Alistipes sp.]
MKTIKIFLASSDELEIDRARFGNLVRRLDRIYRKRGISLDLIMWEDLDAAYNGVRKQLEYNRHICASDMFLAVFHRLAGPYTREEFDVASKAFKQQASPKIYTYFKDLAEGEQESKELIEFKRRLFDELEHYWCRYGNTDTMQLHFVMQLQLVESDMPLKMELQGEQIMLGDNVIARMDNLPFAACNEDYLRLRDAVNAMEEEFEKAERRASRYPDDEEFQEEAKKKQAALEQAKRKYANYGNTLFETAQKMAAFRMHHITERKSRAIEAFERGAFREALAILAEAERDAEASINQYKRAVELTDECRKGVYVSIDELKVKVSIQIANRPIESWKAEEKLEPHEDWIKNTPEEPSKDWDKEVYKPWFEEIVALYGRLGEMALTLDDKDLYFQLQTEYDRFLQNEGYNANDVDPIILSIKLNEQLLIFAEEYFGKESYPVVERYMALADAYNTYSGLGRVYRNYGEERFDAIRESVIALVKADGEQTYRELDKHCFDAYDEICWEEGYREDHVTRGWYSYTKTAALLSYKRALALLEQLSEGAERVKAQLCEEIAAVYQSLNTHGLFRDKREEGLQFYERGLQYAMKDVLANYGAESREMCDLYRRYAGFYEEEEVAYLQKALQIAERLEQPELVADICDELACTLPCEEALEYNLKGLESMKGTRLESDFCLSRARLYIECDRWEEAAEYAQMALDRFISDEGYERLWHTRDVSRLLRIYDCLTEIAEKRGDWQAVIDLGQAGLDRVHALCVREVEEEVLGSNTRLEDLPAEKQALIKEIFESEFESCKRSVPGMIVRMERAKEHFL